MRRLLPLVGVFCVACVIGRVARAADGPEKLATDKLPKAIAAAVETRFPGAKITAAEKEMENGKLVYDIELTHKGRKYEMDIQEGGVVIEIEKEFKSSDLPAAALATIKQKYPQAKIADVMEVNMVSGKEEKPDHYEVTLTDEKGKTFELIVSLDGKSVESEKK